MATAVNQLLKVLGIVGSGVSRDTLTPMLRGRDSTEETNQIWDRSSIVQNPEVWGVYGSYMQQPETLDQQMLLWHEMVSWDLVTAALGEMAEEATQPDFVTGHSMWYECTDKKVEKELMEMRDALHTEEHLLSQVWHVAGYGNNFERLHYEAGNGVTGSTFAHPIDVRRYWLAENRQCVGFFWKQQNPPDNNKFSIGGNSFINGSLGGAGAGNAPKNLWFPWDFCFTGDTKISLLDGRELSLEQIQQEVGEGEFWVYSVTPEGRVVPGKAHSLKMTRRAADIVEVELDNGEKVKCTPDHKFMLRDGTYREAGQLTPGDSLMPLYRKLSTLEEHDRDGYELFLDNDTGAWRFTHWRVAEEVHGTKRNEKGQFGVGYHVHHKSFEKRNNDPRELEWMAVAAHNKLHTDLNRDPVQKARCREARSVAMKRTWETQRELMLGALTVRARSPEGRATASANGIALRERRKADPALDQKIRKTCRQNVLLLAERRKSDPELDQRLREINRENGRARIAVLHEREKTDPELALRLREARSQNMAALNRSGRMVRRKSGAKTTAVPFNHKVVSVKPAGNSDVFDFEVDEHHNFALSAGVFVHNCHMRRMQRSRINEHGEPVFKEAQGIYKKLRLAIDQMVVHRLQIQPDRYVVKVDVQGQPPAEQMRTLQRWQQMFRKRHSFGSGQSPANMTITDFRSQYDPLALDTVLYLPIAPNFMHAIDKLNGTAVVPDIFDIEMLMNLFFGTMGMPLSWLGLQKSGGGDATSGPVSGKALLAQDMRFLRKTRSIRKAVIDAHTWVGYFHAVLRNHDIENLNLVTRMSDISSLEDQMRLELLQSQADLLERLSTDLGDIGVPPHIMVDLIFKRYMRLPPDIVNAVITALPTEAPQEESTKVKPGAERKIMEFLRKETAMTGNIQKLVEILGRGEQEMKGFLDGKLRAEVLSRLPTKKSRALMESLATKPERERAFLCEMDFKPGLSSARPPVPAVAGATGGLAGRQYL